MPLIVTGSIGIDTVEAPSGIAVDVLGGSAVYFAAAASFFGPVRLVAAVGEDAPARLEQLMAHFGVDTAGLERRAGSRTFRWSGKYFDDMNQRETVAVDLNVLAEAPAPVPDAYQNSRHIFLANTDPGSQMQLLEHFPDRAIAVADTMDIWIKEHRASLDALLARVDGLVLNDSEAEALTGQRNMVHAGKAIRGLGPQFAVIKRGEHGALLSHEDGVAVLPAFPTADVVDPTGAGDAFAGGMMGHLAAVKRYDFDTLRVAMAWGTVVASFNIESFSLECLQRLDRSDIDRRLNQYRGMLQLDMGT